jgi:hypothetical protein
MAHRLGAEATQFFGNTLQAMRDSLLGSTISGHDHLLKPSPVRFQTKEVMP